MSTLIWNLRLALRRLLSRPALTLAAILCGALGIGLCTTIFSTFFAMILRPFPFASPDSIVALVAQNPKLGIERSDVSSLDYLELRRQAPASLQEIAGFTQTTFTFSGSVEPERLSGAAVSANLFTLLRINPTQGRSIHPEDDRVGASRVVLLSHEFWTRSFGADPQVINSTVQIDNLPHVVIGVMPAGFQYPNQQQAWVPLAPRLEANRPASRGVQVLARMSPEASLPKIRSDVEAIAAQMAEQYPETHANWQLKPLLLRDLFVSPGMRIMSMTMVGAAILVLLIACSNVANLFLAQAVSRRPEITMRAALGASPGRIISQLLTETLLVMIGGGLLGTGLAAVGIRALERLFPASNPIPYWMEFALDPAVLVFTAVVTVVAGIAAGLVPALDSAKLDLVSLVNAGGRGASSSRGRLRSSLVVVEVALSMVLLIGGALFVRSFFELQKETSGFDESDLTTLRIHLSGTQFGDSEFRIQKMHDLLQRIQLLPGVESAFASSTIPLAGGSSISAIEIAGQASSSTEKPRVYWTGVTPQYFETLRVPIERGRSFDETEGWNTLPVAVVNRRFIERFIPEGEALSQSLSLEQLDKPEDPLWFTIVGVVPDFKIQSLDRPAPAMVYLPYPFLANRTNGIVIRNRRESTSLLPQVREEVRATHPGIPVFDPATMQELRNRSLWQLQLVSRMFTIFGLIALVLATTGLYGILTFTMNQQRREIGIRMALGAQRRAMVAPVVRHGLRLVGSGLAIGLVLALLLTRVLSSFLYGISAVDPVSFVGLSIFLLCVAILATLVPAWRATQVEAVQVLREN